jgi:hypothetical protein
VDVQPNLLTASWNFRDLPPAAMTRSLPSALDDPDKYVAAHCLLTHWVWRQPFQAFASDLSGGRLTYIHNGLRVELLPDDAELVDTWLETGAWIVRHRSQTSWHANPTQQPAIRDG